MDKFANEPEHRDEAFGQAAAELGFAKAIVEKDFWVCWSLQHLFALPSFGDHLIFKGGTSLSKAYDVIHRFSEDVDLSLDRAQLGFDGDRDPEQPNLSGGKRRSLLEDLQEEFGLTYMFIAHDLSVVQHISTRVAVMYLGRVVEIASTDQLYSDPRHPYTETLLEAIPRPDPRRRRKRVQVAGDLPNPIDPPTGCHFHTRCPIRKLPLCATSRPELKTGPDGRAVACHLRG